MLKKRGRQNHNGMKSDVRDEKLKSMIAQPQLSRKLSYCGFSAAI